MTTTENRKCECCGRILPVSDWDEPGSDEVALDAAGVKSLNNYVCGKCLSEE